MKPGTSGAAVSTVHAHTPGPWKATASYGELTDHPYLVWSVPRDRALAQCFRISESGEDSATEQAANAALIASAPALAAEVERLRAERKDMIAGLVEAGAEVERLRAALRDVLRYCVTVDGLPDKDRGRTADQQAALDAARAALNQ